MVRKMGAMAAAPFLLEGKLSDPKAALAAGIVDEVVPPEELMDRARAWVLSAAGTDLRNRGTARTTGCRAARPTTPRAT
jgi:3-hydroxyacyl-CoA dehydrogenase/enoyl-CoA hydratase/3-hydroxybutyryl-CoA epimerase